MKIQLKWSVADDRHRLLVFLGSVDLHLPCHRLPLVKAMMALVLQPTLADYTTEELERHIEAVRARRIVAVMEYVAGQQLKLDTEKDKAHRKLKGHYEMLAKELERCDRAIYALDERVAAIEMLRQEIGLMDTYGE